MAVTEGGPAPDDTPAPTPADGDAGATHEASTPADNANRLATAPGHGVHFEVDTHKAFGYRVCRWIVVGFAKLWFRPSLGGPGRVPASGPVVIAPVHRSFADFLFAALITDRKLFFMVKDSVWKSPLLGRIVLYVGGFPVHRESADRQALLHAEDVLRHDAVLVIFPEGTRQEGPVLGDLLEGAAFLAARAGATLVPLGIGGSDRAMPKGSRIPRPFHIRLVVGETVAPPARSAAGRVSRSKVHESNEQLRASLQAAYDQSRA